MSRLVVHLVDSPSTTSSYKRLLKKVLRTAREVKESVDKIINLLLSAKPINESERLIIKEMIIEYKLKITLSGSNYLINVNGYSREELAMMYNSSISHG